MSNSLAGEATSSVKYPNHNFIDNIEISGIYAT